MSKKKNVTQIDKKIIGWSTQPAAGATPANDGALDRDPRYLRIEKREDGSWESVTTKITLTSATGKKTIYFVIGFGVVCGREQGETVCIERPLEFFVPAGQTAAEHQWVSATMRTLSLAARGGFLVKALADLRKVSWDRGQVRLGEVQRPDGHRSPRWHDSEVAALGYAIQQILHRRGFLDAEGNQVPSRLLARLPRGKMVDTTHAATANANTPRSRAADDGGTAASASPSAPAMLGSKCDYCGANAVIRKDGCDFCTACGEIGACG